ncbi:MAG: HepT-like ribonuclease domain-containing protein [Cyanobacteria bacterium J06641_2]
MASLSLAMTQLILHSHFIGEATKQLSTEVRAAYPSILWQQIAGFRDVLIHDYLKVNLNRVWGVIETSLPELKATVEEILPDSQR